MKYYVYLLISISSKNNKVISYVGYTNNLKRRLFLHNNSQGAKFTRGKKWNLAYSKIFKSKSLAMKKEYELKKDSKIRSKIKNDFLKKKFKND